jgi:hypothetical protein
MATKSEIKKEVTIALSEIGVIVPWFDNEFNTWIYSNPLYPIECEGQNAEEVVKKYPQYLEVFISHRMDGTLDSLNEKKTKGKGGYRPGSGRPKGSVKELKKRIYIPADIADWFEHYPNACQDIRKLMHRKTG